MHWIHQFTCFLSIGLVLLFPYIAAAANTPEVSLSNCEQTQTAKDGYATHKRITVSAHPAFRLLCIPVYQDTLLLAGEDTQAYFTLVGFQHNKAYFDYDAISTENAQPGREFDNYRKHSDGQKRRYINAVIPHNDAFSRMMVYLLPWALFNDEHFFHYFCPRACKPDKQRHPARWGGNRANEFEKRRVFKAFMENAFPAINTASLPLDTTYAYITSDGRGDYNFLTNKLELSLSFQLYGIYKPKVITELLRPTAIYEDESLYDKDNVSPPTGTPTVLRNYTGRYDIEMNAALAEKIYNNKGMRCITKIKILDWVFADSMGSSPKRKLFIPVWESASDQVECFTDNAFDTPYFSFNWRTGERI